MEELERPFPANPGLEPDLDGIAQHKEMVVSIDSNDGVKGGINQHV